ncbi:cholesterol oxidase [Catenulispora sp. GP43]|uniref:GMC oxidoreductase n=1 Tax=Catenulispora sp. GP43 TaxID=3156263 RepID=UPI0035195F18
MGAAVDYDVLVIGSGFGGSVTALRLTEKGYKVGVLEAGRRFADGDFPKTSWRLRSFLWAPKLGCKGIQRIHRLKDVVVLAGAGVGGGSLVYANTLYEPLDPFYDDPHWRDVADWRKELAPFYDQAKRMLGVVQNPTMTPADVQMKAVAEEMGVGDTFHLTPVGVFFGDPDAKPDAEQGRGTAVSDPFFGGAGPDRNPCLQCGACMTGCRHNAKNTLVKNYLYLAEKLGAEVHPLTTVETVTPLPDGGGYRVTVSSTGKWLAKGRRTLSAEHVVFSAGALGTQRLLHKLAGDGSLPALSPRLGELTRTNSESLLGAMAKKPRQYDFTEGVAITSSFHPDEHTHIEPVRYGRGSGAMGLLKTGLTDGEGRTPRWIKLLGIGVKHPSWVPRMLPSRKFAERSIILLVMQALDNSLTVSRKRGLFRKNKLTTRQGHGLPNPTWIPAGNEAVTRTAARIDGIPGGTVGDLFNIPMTAHIIGGCVIGRDRDHGVVDPYHRVFGHPGLYIADGSTVSANLGVNPSLTITAMAERAAAFWPNKGETDTRPAMGDPYKRIPYVRPTKPAVPEAAPGALRLPIVEIR